MLAAFRKTLSQKLESQETKKKVTPGQAQEKNFFVKITENVRFQVRQAMLGETASFLTEACLTSAA